MSAPQLQTALQSAGCPDSSVRVAVAIAMPTVGEPIDGNKLASELASAHERGRALWLRDSHWAFLLWAAQCALTRADAGPVAKARLTSACQRIEQICEFTGELKRFTDQNWEVLGVTKSALP